MKGQGRRAQTQDRTAWPIYDQDIIRFEAPEGGIYLFRLVTDIMYRIDVFDAQYTPLSEALLGDSYPVYRGHTILELDITEPGIHNILKKPVNRVSKCKLAFLEVTTSMDENELQKMLDWARGGGVKKATVGVVELSSSSFDDFLIVETDMPVLVYFWADWSMPCRMMSPVMEELAKEYVGKAKFGKVNVDDNPQIVERYRIKKVPHFLFFRKRIRVEEIVGAVGREPLENALKRSI